MLMSRNRIESIKIKGYLMQHLLVAINYIICLYNPIFLLLKQ